MTTFKLQLENGIETLDLNDISEIGTGVQAIAGLTGFGLPPVEVQWSQGAGEGAKYRGHRVVPRDIDIPIHIKEANRASLKNTVRKLARILQGGEITLRLFEDTNQWTLNVVRVGGGDISYGADTIGETEFETVLTLRAGNPFWVKSTETVVDLGNPSAGTGAAVSIAVDPAGSASVWPTWEIHGPGINFTAMDMETGERLLYAGPVEDGEVVTINTQDATAENQDGDSRYDGMGRAPNFFPLSPNASNVHISFDNTSSDYIELIGSTIYNEVPNPTFDSGTTGWTLAGSGGATYDGVGKRVWIDSKRSVDNPGFVKSTVTGLTSGKQYHFRAIVSRQSNIPSVKTWVRAYVKFNNGTEKAMSVWVDKTVLETSTITVPFTVPAGQTSVEIGVEAFSNILHKGNVYVNDTYVGPAGYFFNGDTADTASVTYDWTGTPHASRSYRAASVPASTANAKVVLRYRDREWLVI